MREPRLTIGMACYDDFDGVYFTVTSSMIHHAEVMDDCEFVVVDNHPDSEHGRLVRHWIESKVPNGKYFPFESATGTAQSRNEVFRQASGKAVLCLDCHVLLVPGALRKLIEYHAAHPGSRDLLCGPLIKDSGAIGATHQRPEWGSGAWGKWSVDERGKDPNGEPFEIWQHGMGLFSCRRDAWVGFHPHFRGFGGCESYIMERIRRNGGRVLCCPWLRWAHRFPRVGGAPYRVTRRDKLRNYLIGFGDLGWEVDPVLQHFKISRRQAESLVQEPEHGHRFAVVGHRAFVGVKMRGDLLRKHLGCKLLRPHHLAQMHKREVIVAIKKGFDHGLVRAKCDRLVYDPLDVFSNSCRPVDPVEFWRSQYLQLQFDDIIATSPACRDFMRQALPDQVRVHLVPHQSDPRVHPGWRDPDGPVAYAGLQQFVSSGLDRIEKACRLIGRELVVGAGCEVLQGASLALAFRLPPYDTPLYRCCKPQIKLENAAAARMPVVATDCPAATSLYPGIETVPVDFSPAALAEAMLRALDRPGLSNPFTNDKYLHAMNRVLDRRTKVVFTAIFGGYDQLREPRELAPGVQYICFTDNPHLKSRGWQIRYCPPTGDPLLQAKRIKVLAHEVLHCETSLWLDGRVELRNLNGVFERFPAELALQRHPERNCIYEEADFCKRVGRGDPARIDDAVARYRAAGHPTQAGLWLGGIVLRRHTPAIAAFNREWWRHLESGTSRDQLILPVLLRRMRVQFETLPLDTPRHQVGRHLD